MVVPTRLIAADIEVPGVVEVPAGVKTVEVAVRTGLTNVSEHDVVLHAPDEDAEIFWHVLDENHREVLREVHRPLAKTHPPKPGVETFRSVTVAAGHGEHETETLVLDAPKLKNGHTYTVRAEIFGQIAEAEFVAVKVEAAAAAKKPAAKKGAKPAAKKGAKPAAAQSSATAKKPAAKQGAGRRGK